MPLSNFTGRSGCRAALNAESYNPATIARLTTGTITGFHATLFQVRLPWTAPARLRTTA